MADAKISVSTYDIRRAHLPPAHLHWLRPDQPSFPCPPPQDPAPLQTVNPAAPEELVGMDPVIETGDVGAWGIGLPHSCMHAPSSASLQNRRPWLIMKALQAC